jgi:hypothetical protein
VADSSPHAGQSAPEAVDTAGGTDGPAVPAAEERAYGCTFACGNPYDYVVVQVSDGTTEFLCLPCFVKLASDMVEAVTNPASDSVTHAVNSATPVDHAPMMGVRPKRRGKNAPVTADDPDVFTQFSTTITVDELPDEFR